MMFVPKGSLSFIPFVNRYLSDVEYFKNEIQRIIDHRARNKDSSSKDILSLLLDGAGNNLTQEKEDLAPLSHSELISNCFIMIVAGHETTARTLAFALYLLAKHPDIQRTAQDQIDTIGLNYDSLTHVTNIIKETLRLYPAAVAILRMTTQDIEFKGTKLNKGVYVLYMWYLAHIDDKYWDRALEFIPDRWTTDKRNHEFHYSPFGVGKRSCIGKKFSEIEMVVVLSMILKRYNIKFEKEPYDLDLMVNITLRSKNPIHLVFERRDEE
ncbi:cytochrome P450 [Acrasis kona]|uniref:Cytochrome P450 n=1 Tax=Acrasis kona TaxID=1008807 RepID=A0AAW2YU28_9EUKA